MLLNMFGQEWWNSLSNKKNLEKIDPEKPIGFLILSFFGDFRVLCFTNPAVSVDFNVLINGN